jgi:hypothetical protein
LGDRLREEAVTTANRRAAASTRQESEPAQNSRAIGSEAERLRFDVQTLTVTLDNKPFKISNPKAFSVYKAIADSRPNPITRASIQSRVPGCRGEKTIRRLLNTLQEPLRECVQSGPAGYWLELRLLPGPHQKGRT